AGAFHDSPAGPRALPGDVLPPFGMVDAAGTLPPPPPLPPGVHLPGPGDPPESTAPGLPLAAATRAAAAAVAACERGGSRVGATVIDSAGEARAMLSADGSNGSHVFVAMRKAEVALAFARPSSQVAAAAARDPGVAARVGPAMFVEGGAVPIFRRGKVIGALGVSGAGGAVIGRADELCALAGLKALGRR
ncbi:MAG TPA: heme-binding protein, partial [Novosphingobium sp.]|nr:heme-binding protein [Novosphingobium sp.]